MQKSELSGHWGEAILREGCVLIGRVLLLVMEWGLLLAAGLSIVFQPGEKSGWRVVIIAGITALDWFFLSPFLLWRESFYFGRIAGEAPLPLFREGRYGCALRWRAGLWGRRLWFTLIGWTPGITLWSVGEKLRLEGDGITGSLLLVSGSLLLVVGWIGVEAALLRYRAAPYFIAAEGLRPGRALSQSGAVLWRHWRGMTGLYGWWFWRLCSCLLLFPALYVLPRFRMAQAKKLRHLIRATLPATEQTLEW